MNVWVLPQPEGPTNNTDGVVLSWSKRSVWIRCCAIADAMVRFNFSRKNANCQYAKSGRTVDVINIVNTVKIVPKKKEKTCGQVVSDIFGERVFTETDY